MASGVRRRARRPDGRACQRQYRVDADGAKQRALARHVRAADDQQLRVARQMHVVPHHRRGRQQGMAELGAVEESARAGAGRGADDLRERIVRPLEVIGRERRERLELADRLEPHANLRSVLFPPAVDRNRHVRPHELEQRAEAQRQLEVSAQEDRERKEQGVALGVVQHRQAMQPLDRGATPARRRWTAARAVRSVARTRTGGLPGS